MNATEELTDFVAEIMKDGRATLAKKFQFTHTVCVSPVLLGTVLGNAQLLIAKLGPYGRAWAPSFNLGMANTLVNAQTVFGVLTAIQDAVKGGRLTTIEERVAADILGDLVGHAEELIKAKFMLPAAVVLRAVLEERLRKMVNARGPEIPDRPTIEDLKAALRKDDTLGKIDVKNIDWMTGVGNAAAHAKDEFNPADVPNLYQNTLTFLAKFSA